LLEESCVLGFTRLFRNTYSFSFLKYDAGISTGGSKADTPLNCSRDLFHS